VPKTVRLTPEAWGIIQELAQARGVTPSEVIEQAVRSK
jgi:predicted transcriptional regulator